MSACAVGAPANSCATSIAAQSNPKLAWTCASRSPSGPHTEASVHLSLSRCCVAVNGPLIAALILGITFLVTISMGEGLPAKAGLVLLMALHDTLQREADERHVTS